MLSQLGSKGRKAAVPIAAALGALAAGGLTAVEASEEFVHPYSYPWNHSSLLKGLDHASMRRGYEVYRQVCSTCHSMRWMNFRNLVGNTHTSEQAKALAASYDIKDGPNAEGEYFERPGALYDAFPSPYPNKEYAQFINGGANPPDLTTIAHTTHSEENYVFSVLTGFCEPPFGVKLREGTHYNPYFNGGVIGMAPPLMNEGVEYEDGTIPTVSQQAKDVSTFLLWTVAPEFDERKRLGLKLCTALSVLFVLAGYRKRFKWAGVKNRKISWNNTYQRT